MELFPVLYSDFLNWAPQLMVYISFEIGICLVLKGMTKVKVGKEDPSSADFVEKRRASLER